MLSEFMYHSFFSSHPMKSLLIKNKTKREIVEKYLSKDGIIVNYYCEDPKRDSKEENYYKIVSNSFPENEDELFARVKAVENDLY